MPWAASAEKNTVPMAAMPIELGEFFAALPAERFEFGLDVLVAGLAAYGRT